MTSIIFWGPVDENRLGGGEIGNQRTLDILRNNGYSICLIKKPYPASCNIQKLVQYPFALVSAIINLTVKIINCKDLRICHVCGYYNHLISFEITILLIAKIFSLKTVYEIRGGAAQSSYVHRSVLYRLLFKATIKSASIVLCQGSSDVKFIKDINPHKPVFHYPNTVCISAISREKNTISSPIKLIYFGRVTKDKGVDKVVEVANILLNHYNFNIKMLIIGEGKEDYIKFLNKTVNCNSLSDSISIKKKMNQDNLFQALKEQHFFVFPSQETMEGHSNALTEAMAFGVVPVCSNNGFNKDIVGPCGVILDYEASPDQYAEEIFNIYNQEIWMRLSECCANRIQKNFSYESVSSKLINAYKRLL